MAVVRAALLLLGVLLTIAFIGAWRAYSRDIAVAQARLDAGSKLIETPCGPIEYAAVGAGAPLLMIHGAGGGFDQSLAFGQPLLRGGFRIVAPSRFGYLRTPVPADVSPQAQADAHACLLDALGLDSVVVLGASAGAPSAMQFCIRHPARCQALVLMVPAAYTPARVQQSMKVPAGLQFVAEHVLTSDPVLWTLIKLWPTGLLQTMLATPAGDFERAEPAERARAIRILNDVLPVSRRVEGLAIDARVTSSLPRFELERIAAPTLLITVEDDLFGTYENARYTAQQIRGAQFVAYPSGGHIWLGHEAEVWRTVAGFARGL
ncbi:MAG: alpha/beta hydrolase [Sinimarinibacterium sp.]|jgi:pimeloyl-ACP methyl ester carboxylesterase